MLALQPKTGAKPNRWHRTTHVVTDAATRFISNRCAMLGASIAFYSAFSLAPTLLIVLAVIGWLVGTDAAQGQLFNQVHLLLGNDAAHAMQDIVQHAHHSGGGGIATAFSIVLLLIGASATFSSLNTALDIVFPVSSRRGIAGLALVLRARLVSIGLLIGLSFLLVVSLVVDAAIQTLGTRLFGSPTVGALANAKAAEIQRSANAAAYRFDADRRAFAAGGKAFLLDRYYNNLDGALSKIPVTILDHRLNSADGPVLDLRATASFIVGVLALAGGGFMLVRKPKNT